MPPEILKMPHHPSATDIQAMFDELAPRYDRFNRLVSLGLDRLWREEVLKNVRSGQRILDLGCGTGDLAIAAAKRMDGGEVTALDFSAAMLDVARRRSREQLGPEDTPGVRVRFVQGSAVDFPLAGKKFDLVVSGFLLRNIYEHIEKVMEGVRKSLEAGGRIAFVDFTEPPGTVRQIAWKIYMKTAGAVCSLIAFGPKFRSSYLTDSAKRFLKPHEFCALLRASGFCNIRMRRFMLGVIVLYEAEKA